MDSTIDVEESERGWSPVEDETLKKWLELLTRTIFIYDYTLSRYRSIFRKISIINIILAALTASASMCTTSLLGTYTSDTNTSAISNESSIYASLALSIFSIVGGCIISIVNSVKVLYGWENTIASISSHIRTAIDLRASVNVQLSLPYHLRKKVDDYITKYTQKFEDFQAASPNIGEENFTRGNALYEAYLQTPKSVKMMIISS